MDRRAVVAEAQRTAAEPRGCKGLVWKRHWHWSHLSSDGRGSEGRFPDAPPQGASLWLAPCPRCMRQAPRKRSGPVAHFMGYYSTLVRILQWGVALSNLPSSTEREEGAYGGGGRCPTQPHPPTLLETGGLAVPPAGAAPPAPCLGRCGGRRLLTWRAGLATYANGPRRLVQSIPGSAAMRPDACYVPDSVKVSYEISFTCHFCKPQPLRS